MLSNPDSSTSSTPSLVSKNAIIPLWGVPLLILGLVFSAFVLALIGADALGSGYWGWGMMWGVAAFILLGTTFLISRLASPEGALVIAGIFWVVIVVGSHAEFYSQAQDNVYRWSHAADPTSVPDGWQHVPPEWKQLDREAVYRAWMADVLDEPDASGWWSHLRANATAGLSNFERAVEFVEGKPGYREVHRTDWRVWAGWISSAVFAALGCLLAIAGAAVWSSRVHQEAQTRRFADQVVDKFGQAMRDHGASAEQIRSVIRRPQRKRPIDTPITLQNVAKLLPNLNDRLISTIQEDLELNRQWDCHSDDRRALSGERLERAQTLIARFYDNNQSLLSPRASWLLVLIAAARLHEANGQQQFWPALRSVYGVLRTLGLTTQLPAFRRMDLRDLSFERIVAGPKWKSLASGETPFYSPQAAWPQLADLSAEEIPLNAYPAIVHQTYSMPDPRVYEGWFGVTPREIADRLGPRLRDALLTYINEHQQPDRCRRRQNMDGLATLAADWPFEIAAPIIERALQAGWHQSAAGVPETPEWKALLDRYDDSPFGTLRQYVKWYIKLKREEVRRATGKSYVGF